MTMDHGRTNPGPGPKTGGLDYRGFSPDPKGYSPDYRGFDPDSRGCSPDQSEHDLNVVVLWSRPVEILLNCPLPPPNQYQLTLLVASYGNTANNSKVFLQLLD